MIQICLDNHYPTRHNQLDRRRRSLTWVDENSSTDNDTGPDEGIDSTQDAAADSQFWLSIADLYRQPCFWRVWVVQEAVLAQSASVRRENVEIDWRWVGLPAALLTTNYHGICEKLQIGGVYNAYLMYRLSHMSDLPSPQLSLTRLLRLTWQLEITDPRDRVYGLSGIKTEGNDPKNGLPTLAADYTISEAELWKLVAWRTIQTTNSLNVLSSAQHSTETCESEEALGRYRLGSHRFARFRSGSVTRSNDSAAPAPSWVPKWDLVYRTSLLPWDDQDSFSTCRDFPLVLYSDMGAGAPHILRVGGIPLGKVGFAGIYMWHTIDTSLLLSPHLGPFFSSKVGLRLLSYT